MTETGGDKGRFSVSSTPKETKRKETVLRLLHTKGDRKTKQETKNRLQSPFRQIKKQEAI